MERQQDVRSFMEVKFTWARRKHSVSEVHLSAINDHFAMNKHSIDWEGVKFPSRNCDTTTKGVWEAIVIKRIKPHTRSQES